MRMIKKFQTTEEYEQWLKWQSFHTREKAKKFAEQYGNVIPIVLVIDGFTPQGGEWAPAYVFLHPEAQELLGWLVL